MIKATAQSLRDFEACHLYYKYYYMDGDNKPTSPTVKKTQDLFRETLISIVNFFFYKKMDGQEPSYKMLESRWQRKWLKDIAAEEIINHKNTSTNSHPHDAAYTTRATRALLAFHKYFKDRPDMEVVLLDEQFLVPLTREVALEGSFDLVLRNKKPDGTFKYHIFTWSVYQSNRSSEYWATHFTVLDYAFRYRRNFEKNLDVSYYVWDYTHFKTIGVRQFLIEVQDHELLRQWAGELAETELHVPRRGLSAYCKTCRFDRKCLNWSYDDAVKELQEKGVEIKRRTK